MIEQYLAISLLFVVCVLGAPIALMVICDRPSGNEKFLEAYKGAFKAAHVMLLAAAAITSVFIGVFWAVGVLAS